MRRLKIAYLGPEGTFSHEIARKRFAHAGHPCIGLESVEDVCAFVAKSRNHLGVVPIDNSSGGTIYVTVDELLRETPPLQIQEEITLEVQLALLGRRGGEVRRIYTHFAPIRHCRDWLHKHYPRAEVIETGSTAIAAREAASHADTGAIANRAAAGIYGLDVLKHPIPIAIRNETNFFVLAKQAERLPRIGKTTLAIYLKNESGSLSKFLHPMAEDDINLSRIISRPIEGRPREFAFLIDVDASIHRPPLTDALQAARSHAARIRVLGSYPCHRSYRSS